MGRPDSWPEHSTTLLAAAVAGYATYVGSYKASRWLSPLITASYSNLSEKKKLEWDARWPSTLHAVVLSSAAGYLFLCTDLFSDSKEFGDPVILRMNPLSTAALGYSLGYFSTDLVMLCAHYPDFGGAEMGLHHVAAWMSIAVSGIHEEGHLYTLALLGTECTTPFINARWMLDAVGLRSSRIYLVNGLALVADWFVIRILLFLWFFAHMYTHSDEIYLVSVPCIILLLTVPVLLFTLNLFWFFKILAGARKLLFGGRDRTLKPEELDSSIGAAFGAPRHDVSKDKDL
ncbi:hypothetical protein ACKKBF_B01870 [Auxenochlorella protothecoides x Auxenochlorella symbiontica]